MKKALLILSSFTALLLGQGCKNDLNILAPYKDITVVYGLLDQNDTAHYIRVNKAYEGPGDAYTMGKQYDSIYYPTGSITVQLLEYNGSALNNTITLVPDSSIPVSPGNFSYPKQMLYKTKYALNSNYTYNLAVKNNKTGKTITGSTALLPDVNITTPLFMSTFAIDLSSSQLYAPPPVAWASNGQAIIYQLTLRFFYNEIDSVKKDTTHDYVDWIFPAHVSPSLEQGFQFEDTYYGTAFFQLLVGSISPVQFGTPIKRVPVNVEVLFTSGTQDLNTYIQLSQPSLGVNQEKPFYTDVQNAVGLFTARHTQTVFKPLTSRTIDSLEMSPTLVPLNFRSF